MFLGYTTTAWMLPGHQCTCCYCQCCVSCSLSDMDRGGERHMGTVSPAAQDTNTSSLMSDNVCVPLSVRDSQQEEKLC